MRKLAWVLILVMGMVCLYGCTVSETGENGAATEGMAYREEATESTDVGGMAYREEEESSDVGGMAYREEPDADILGSWEVGDNSLRSDFTGTDFDWVTSESTVEFLQDGTVHIYPDEDSRSNGLDKTGTWSLDGNTLNMSVNGVDYTGEVEEGQIDLDGGLFLQPYAG